MNLLTKKYIKVNCAFRLNPIVVVLLNILIKGSGHYFKGQLSFAYTILMEFNIIDLLKRIIFRLVFFSRPIKE
ncbi:MAG: hypothetical protein AMK71_09125 [Nitrospira bacterium SG8_35_4]|nr:MAG: hypothetical protein AMK71_09125 [Nitrospira bacterium SG8_35_4]